MGKEIRVLYLCDGEGCEYICHREVYVCEHTTDPQHAVNGACEQPELHPERFTKHEDKFSCFYIEKPE